MCPRATCKPLAYQIVTVSSCLLCFGSRKRKAIRSTWSTVHIKGRVRAAGFSSGPRRWSRSNERHFSSSAIGRVRSHRYLIAASEANRSCWSIPTAVTDRLHRIG